MKKIIITGSDDYAGYLYRHLLKEHPSTKRKMKLIDINKVKRRCKHV